MFSYAFTTWVVVQMFLVSGAGVIMDKIGLRALKILAVLLYSLGTVMFAFTSKGCSHIIFVAGVLVAVGSTSTLICNQQISLMFPRLRGIAISLMSGAFDSGTLVTFVISQTVPVISLKLSFLILAGSAFVYGVLMALFVLTRWAPDMANLPGNQLRTAYAKFEDDRETPFETKSDKQLANELDERIDVFLLERYPSVRKCLLSWPFLAGVTFMMFGVLRHAYFLGQLGQQLHYLFDRDQETIENFEKISSALLMGGLIISPVSGFVLDVSRAYYRQKMIGKFRELQGCIVDEQLYCCHLRSIAPAFLLIAVSATIYSMLMFVKHKITFYFVFFFYVLVRSLLFSATVNFILNAFPVRYFGTITGIMSTMAGLFSLIQSAMLQLDPVTGNELAVAACTVLFFAPLVLFFKRQ
ncbi:unnamed protein product [Calicophoron daubneyi]|uniref:Solute carrier family 43 member 3 n=1 Tax=Calicophoron daubneyi TaxID=300641 RepID=A0AAV2TZS7_CALDB